MIQGLYTYAATALVAAALAGAGAWRVQEWRWQANTKAEADLRAEAERIEREARDTDTRQQRKFNDQAAAQQAAALARINQQLGDARAHIATLSADRQCLDAGTVGLLNNIATPTRGLGLRATASSPAGTPSAAAAPGAHTPNLGYASERDTARWIATCRAQYGAVAEQLEQILDIEDDRERAAAALAMKTAGEGAQ